MNGRSEGVGVGRRSVDLERAPVVRLRWVGLDAAGGAIPAPLVVTLIAWLAVIFIEPRISGAPQRRRDRRAPHGGVAPLRHDLSHPGDGHARHWPRDGGLERPLSTRLGRPSGAPAPAPEREKVRDAGALTGPPCRGARQRHAREGRLPAFARDRMSTNRKCASWPRYNLSAPVWRFCSASLFCRQFSLISACSAPVNVPVNVPVPARNRRVVVPANPMILHGFCRSCGCGETKTACWRASRTASGGPASSARSALTATALPSRAARADRRAAAGRAGSAPRRRRSGGRSR